MNNPYKNKIMQQEEIIIKLQEEIIIKLQKDNIKLRKQNIKLDIENKLLREFIQDIDIVTLHSNSLPNINKMLDSFYDRK